VLDDAAGEDRAVGFEALSGGFEAEFVEASKRGQVGTGEGVRQVLKFWIG
jgi:hypothetical protein